MTNPPICPVLEFYGWDGRSTGYGEWRNIRCPFHGRDRRPSGRLNETEGVFHCHACGLSGNAFKVIEKHEGVSFSEAKRRVQDITGKDVSQLSGPSSGGFLRGGSSSKLPKWARNRYANRILLSDRARQHRVR